ncbi:hypothetical protein OEA41_003401 [Lepraria neglecta]|uniref:Rhodopsin domain-containing protein n=1 Tax=Lepraria neglecta TaxID=209136 RepID=A0AAD9Z6X2_9LECA|nr:hypothetical protein OEA41_003401 [Lepraria neglecta]
MSSNSAQLSKPPKISQTAFQASTGVLLGIVVIVAVGRTIARFYKSHRIAVDDGFFFLAVTTLVAGTIVLYFDIPYIYLQEDVEAGLRAPPANLVEQLIQDEKLQDATAVLLGTAVVSVKFSFLFFFRGLIRQQKRLMMWWWCILVVLIPTAAILMFSSFMSCPYFDQEIFVKCVTPAALSRENGVLKATAILDIVTDAFLISIPVILLWKVRINMRRKLALWAILCLSIFTMITAIVRIAGGNTSHGQVDSAWVIFWLQAEAAVAVIVVSVTAFRALFVAHKASKHQSPPQQIDDLTSRSMWSKRIREGSSGPRVPEPSFTGVRTYVRRGPYDAGFFDGSQDIELSLQGPLQGPGILVTHNIFSEKVVRPVL